MKTNYQGKRYNSETMEEIAFRDHHNNGNYSGTTRLMRAKDGTYWLITTANGQDCYLNSELYHCMVGWEIDELDMMTMSDEQEARAVELGLLKIV
jgi:hypothetical protein